MPRRNPTTQLRRMHKVLDAAARLMTGAPTWESASQRADLTPDQRAGLRIALHLAAAFVHPTPAGDEKVRTLGKALGAYRESGDKDLSYWRATTLVDSAVLMLAQLPPVADGTGVAKWLAESLAEEVDPRCREWLTRRVEMLEVLRLHAPKRARGKRTTAAIAAQLLVGVGALGLRSKPLDEATDVVRQAVKRYARR